jgi:flavin reductase (DIM6/NTAB) family NADH-FMN oxidoreductase RutF
MAPPRLLVCLNRSGATCAALLAAHAFCVNVLGTDALALAETFAGRTGLSGAEKFMSYGWIADEGHPRALPMPSPRSLFGSSVQLVGTHAIVVGDVEAVWNRPDAQPLVYHDQSFRTLCALD